MFVLPKEVIYIIEALESNGYEAYIVGGCVRDSLLGKTPKDWDICTSALPTETMRVFSNHTTIATGLQHGTLTLVLDHHPYEITTYRIDGNYSDHRRPETVSFVRNLHEDLARRDFRINAMAYHPTRGVADPFGGREDLRNGVIRCVGDPTRRFREDALRIMRAMRFAAVLGFRIDEDTAAAMLSTRDLLSEIAVERIAAELKQMLLGDFFRDIVEKSFPVIAEVLPELAPTAGFLQNHPFHDCDVLTHILKSVEAAPRDPVLRLTMLLHDIGKPQVYSESAGVGHFYGHSRSSLEIAQNILTRLRFDTDTLHQVTELIRYHDAEIVAERRAVKRWLQRLGEQRFWQLLEVQRADLAAQSPRAKEEMSGRIEAVSAVAAEVIREKQCFSLRALAVKGDDLLAAGMSEGREVGQVLERMLEWVIEEKVDNDKDTLLAVLKRKEFSS